MTQETFIVADLADISGIRIDCSKCKATMTLALSHDSVQPPHKCPQCGEYWMQDNTSVRTQVVQFLNSLRDCRKFVKEESFKLRFTLPRGPQ